MKIRSITSNPVAQAGLGLSLAAATLAVTITGAIFTDTTDIGGNAFDTGNVEITTSETTDLVSFSSTKMVPGDFVVDDVLVTNAGTVEMRYAIKSTTTGSAPLAAQLDLSVWLESAETDSVANDTCENTAPANTLRAAGDLGSAAGLNIVGDTAQGNQGADRPLIALAAERLCFKVELPLASDNTYEGLNAGATFAFVAEQTSNNA